MTTVAALMAQWVQLWARLRRPVPVALGEALLAAWGERHRHYHAHQHLGEGLALCAQYIALALHGDEVVLAWWFHDAIYDPKASDNEERSAQWAERVLPECGIAPDAVARIAAMIRATQAHGKAATADEALLLDIDLSILGASPERFAEYEAQIRAEYAWVPALIYRVKRHQVLQGFARQHPIYQTQALRDRFEAAAHANLAG